MSTTQNAGILLQDSDVAPQSRKLTWIGRGITALPAGLLLFSGAMKLTGSTQVTEGFSQMGYPDGIAFPIGVVEILCTLLYIFPRTAVLGAILITGYLGGATDVHVRTGQSVLMPVAVGVVAWLGLYLRDARLRALLPLRKSETGHSSAALKPAEI